MMSDDFDDIDEVLSSSTSNGLGKPKRRLAQKRAEVEEIPEPEFMPEPEPMPEPKPEPEPAPEQKAPRRRKEKEPSMDVADLLPMEPAPKPSENVKTLGDLYAKYGVGGRPEFRIQVWRSWPKLIRGVKSDGFYDSWDVPLSEEQIASEYGGGTFRIKVMGPHPQDPHQLKQYESMEIQIAGEPKAERLPRSMQGNPQAEAQAQGQSQNQPQQQMYFQQQQQPENPKIVEAALKVVSEVAESEREERRRAESNAKDSYDRAEKVLSPVIDAYSKRADDIQRAERERAELERRHFEERLKDERERADREIRRVEEARATEKLELLEIKRKLENIDMNRPSLAAEMRELMPLMGKNDDMAARATERIMESVLEKHRSEMDAIRAQNQQMIDSMRRGHEEEKTSMRESHTRSLESERESSRSREGRIESLLASEREERRRDQERFREMLDERERAWKERMESQAVNLETQYRSRISSMETTYESRIQWLQGEVDRKLGELAELRTKISDNADPLSQIQRMKELREYAKEALGLESASAPSTPAAPAGGFSLGSSSSSGGASGGIAEMVKETLAPVMEGIGENLPSIIAAVASRGAGASAPAQPPAPPPQPKVGDVLQTPQGPMVVVVDPRTGGLGMMPQAAHQQLMAQQQQLRQRNQPGLLPAPQKKPAKKRVQVTQNLAAGLPRQRAPWEGVEEDEPQEQVQMAPVQIQQPAPAPSKRTSRQAEQTEAETLDTGSLSEIEKQAVGVIAKLVHESVAGGDDPEDFVEKMTSQWPPAILKQVTAKNPKLLVAVIKEREPNSLGATPAGEQFTIEALTLLKERVG